MATRNTAPGAGDDMGASNGCAPRTSRGVAAARRAARTWCLLGKQGFRDGFRRAPRRRARCRARTAAAAQSRSALTHAACVRSCLQGRGTELGDAALASRDERDEQAQGAHRASSW
jgi:hypothetical protein